VGTSRKITDDHYGSRGASVNLEVELEAALITDPAKLQERMRQLFKLARQALTDELNADRNGTAPPGSAKPSPPRGQPTNGTQETNGQQNGTPRLATPKQIKAMYAIAKQHGLDLYALMRDRYGLDRPERFTLQQASELIDTLKSAE
jgi:hypothetical protein